MGLTHKPFANLAAMFEGRGVEFRAFVLQETDLVTLSLDKFVDNWGDKRRKCNLMSRSMGRKLGEDFLMSYNL